MLYNLQAVRIFATYLVVLFHFRELSVAAGFAPLRYGGLDILLILTGFLAVKVTADKAVDPGRFLIERLTRVAPLYWVTTLLVFALALIAPGYFQATRADVAELAQSLAFIPFVKSNGLVQPLVYVGWTLNYQVVFYALFAIGLLARPKTLGVGFVCVVLLGLATAGAFLHFRYVDEQFYTSPIILDFVMGMIVAMVFNRLPAAAPDWRKCVLATLGAIAAFAFYLWGGLGGAEASRVLAKGVPATLFLICILALERYGFTLKSNLVNYWAKTTYSIFLTHFFVTGLATHIVADQSWTGTPALLVLIAGLIAVTVAGCLCYEFVEKPLTKLVRRVVLRERADASEASVNLTRA